MISDNTELTGSYVCTPFCNGREVSKEVVWEAKSHEQVYLTNRFCCSKRALIHVRMLLLCTASGLMLNSDITELSLKGCHIGPDGMAHLSQALKTLINLKSLDLSGNRFGSDGVNNLGMSQDHD